TYRYYGHSFSDQRAYRTREEERAWRERDPIELFGRRLIDEELFTAAEVEAIRREAIETIEMATRFAQESPLPEVSELHDNVYVEPEPEAQHALVAAERLLQARVRPAEEALRVRFRETAGSDPRNVLPRLNKTDADALEARFDMPILTYGNAILEAQ